ncbi:MAG: tRNA lysidine(34) synthetase TilS, partial [Chitinophagaceae bacterium]
MATMNLKQQFLDYIVTERLFSKKDHLLIAVSGGLDSVVLASLCSACGYQFSIAHCNFQLRAEESERDEAFVSELARSYSVPVFIKKFDTERYAAENKLSIQVAARHLRYAWFNQLVDGDWSIPSSASNDIITGGKVADFLLTAHQADDNIETSVMNFFKGTGISGIRGMRPGQGKICRPMLFARRNDLEQYARENHLQWVEDSSNNSEKYSRNKFRHSILPMVQETYPMAADNILSNIERFREVEILYRERITAILSRLVQKNGDELKIPVLRLKQFPAKATVCYEIIKGYHFTAAQTKAVLELLDAETGK